MRKLRKKAIKKTVFIILVLLLLTISSIAALEHFSAKPPLKALDQCHHIIGKAVDAEANIYSPKELEKANQLFEQARKELKVQSDRLFILRDYKKSIDLIAESVANAEESMLNTQNKKEKFDIDLKQKLENVSDKIEHFQSYYSHLPLNGNARKNFTNAKLKYLESKTAFERKAYHFVSKNLDEASRLISKSVQSAHSHLGSYFNDFPKWSKWYNETVAWTKNTGSTALVVDKFAHTCYVYKSGKRIKEFPAEFGPNWIGTKLYRGDKATPEGKYFVTKKKAGKQTIYYKALLINYPNEEDKARYFENAKNGRIPKRGFGNLIEVHGEGGKGVNWTQGCVALDNNDMDKVYDLIGNGAPITIVGSLRSLKEINGL